MTWASRAGTPSALSSDAGMNLLGAVRTASAPAARGLGVLVALNDEIQSAREVTKTSTYRLQTFRSPDFGVLGHIDGDGVQIYRCPTRRHAPDTEFDVAGLGHLPRVDIAYSYGGADGTIVDALVAAGFPKANIIAAPQSKTDTENAFNAANIALTKNPNFKHWVAYGLNDEAVLGAVRAAEGRGFKADNMVGIGIGGADSALNEFKKPEPTGFFGTVIISPKRHGEETSALMYTWITQGKEPPKLTLTSGMLATRDNVSQVREQMGLAAK